MFIHSSRKLVNDSAPLLVFTSERVQRIEHFDACGERVLVCVFGVEISRRVTERLACDVAVVVAAAVAVAVVVVSDDVVAREVVS